MTRPTDNYDTPWKHMLEDYFEQFMHFFFPTAHAAIDWSRGYEFLDKELQQIVRDAELGQRLVDKLVKVWRIDGDAAWVLIHIEVQSQEESTFPQRMFVYHYRIYDRYGVQVVSLAVLSDERATWRPNRFKTELWGCGLQFYFPIVKLLDYREQWELLEASRNPFATVVMAHLKTQETRQNATTRSQWRWALTRRLYERGYSRQEIINLIRFINWMMQLPPELETQFWTELHAYEEAQRMPYITYIEEKAEERGEERGRHEGRQEERLETITLALELKFGDDGLHLLPTLQQLATTAPMRDLYAAIILSLTLDDLTQRIAQISAQYPPQAGA